MCFTTNNLPATTTKHPPSNNQKNNAKKRTKKRTKKIVNLTNHLFPGGFKRSRSTRTTTTTTTVAILIRVPSPTTHVGAGAQRLFQPKLNQIIHKLLFFMSRRQVFQGHEKFTVLMDQQHVWIVVDQFAQRSVGQICW